MAALKALVHSNSLRNLLQPDTLAASGTWFPCAGSLTFGPPKSRGFLSNGGSTCAGRAARALRLDITPAHPGLR